MMQDELSADEVVSFERDGYLYVPGFFDADTMADVTRWCEELTEWPEVPGRHMVYYEDHRERAGERILSRIENFCPFHAGLDAVLRGPRIMRCLQQLFGEPALLFKDKINFKIPGSAGFEPHQDVQAGWDRYAPLHITALVSIDDATLSNGCIEMAPGLHRAGLLGDMWTPLGAAIAEDAYVACPTRRGDVVFFDSYAPHRSQPNAHSAPRRVLYVTYNAASAGDQRARYYADKRESYPPDCERDPDREYVYRV